MTAGLRPRTTPSRTVTCAGCGDWFELSARVEYEHRRSGVPHLCRRCRGIHSGPKASMVEAAKAWWLSRYTLDELRTWPPL